MADHLGSREQAMQLDLSSKRAKKLIREHGLTDEEIQQIVASARINLATFDPEYRTNVTQIAEDLAKSRPTIYGWADRAIAATIHSLRNIRTGRPPKERERANGVES
jgi:transposase